jgi:hypothetical protein
MQKELFDRAVKAQYRYATKHGYTFDQPSESLSTIEKDCIILRNSNYDIGIYKVGNKRIRRLMTLFPLF